MTFRPALSDRPSAAPAATLLALALFVAPGCPRPADEPGASEGPTGSEGLAANAARAMRAGQPAAGGTALANAPPAPSSPATAAAPARAGATAPSAARTAALAISSRATVGCRVIRLTGSAWRAGSPVRVGDKWSDAEPVDLAPASSLRLMHTSSTRTWTITGPARLLACEDGAEEIVIGRGALRAEPGAGVRPGAEVWIGTPYGSLRHADGRVDVELGATELRVHVSSGQPWFLPLAPGRAPERRLDAGTARFAAKPHRLPLESASARCAEAAAHAEERARALLSAGPEPLGERAAAHVRARQRAHGICASALATLLAADPSRPDASAPDGAARTEAARSPAAGDAAAREAAEAQRRELRRHDQRWRSVPSLEPASANPRAAESP